MTEDANEHRGRKVDGDDFCPCILKYDRSDDSWLCYNEDNNSQNATLLQAGGTTPTLYHCDTCCSGGASTCSIRVYYAEILLFKCKINLHLTYFILYKPL